MMSTGFINLRVIETTHRMRVPLRQPGAAEMRLVSLRYGTTGRPEQEFAATGRPSPDR
jgi:hypothetical protein